MVQIFGLATLLSALATPAAGEEAPQNPRVSVETSKGSFVIELHAAEAPKTVESFLSYVKEGFYSGTVFHRVIPDFMVQGGGFTADMQQKPTKAPVQNEADNGLKNDRGTLAMARTSNPHSATSQFFVNLIDNDYLNHTSPTPRGYGYTVFGRVIEGMETVDAIAGVATANRGGHANVPVEPVVIEKMTVQGD